MSQPNKRNKPLWPWNICDAGALQLEAYHAAGRDISNHDFCLFLMAFMILCSPPSAALPLHRWSYQTSWCSTSDPTTASCSSVISAHLPCVATLIHNHTIQTHVIYLVIFIDYRVAFHLNARNHIRKSLFELLFISPRSYPLSQDLKNRPICAGLIWLHNCKNWVTLSHTTQYSKNRLEFCDRSATPQLQCWRLKFNKLHWTYLVQIFNSFNEALKNRNSDLAFTCSILFPSIIGSLVTRTEMSSVFSPNLLPSTLSLLFGRFGRLDRWNFITVFWNKCHFFSC